MTRATDIQARSRHAVIPLLALAMLITAEAAAQSETDPPPQEEAAGPGDEAATDPGEAAEGEGEGETEEAVRNMSTLGSMPAEDQPVDAAIGLARPIPRPSAADERLLSDLDGFERALHAYESEVNEFRADLSRLVRSEYDNRRDSVRGVYDNEIRSLRDQERADRLDVMERLREFLRRYPDHPPETPDALFRLAELYFEKESDEYVSADSEYSRQLDLYDLGRVPDIPLEPEKNYTQTIATFGRLVREFSDYRQIDGALYLMAYSQLQMRLEEEAVANFTALVNRYPDSQFAQESWIRIGEYHFEFNEYEAAVAAYQRALDQGEGRLYDEGLFKLGWSYYLTNDYSHAIQTFTTLIDYYEANEDVSEGGPLREEALQYIAVTLAEEDWDLDGVRDLEAGLPRVRNRLVTGADWERDVTERLAEIWFENDRYELSIDLYRFILERWPNDRMNPQRHERIVAALSRQREVEAAFVEQRLMSELYGPGSDWYAAQDGEGNIRAMAYAEDLVRNVLLDTARYFNSEADEARDRAAALSDPETDRLALQRYTDAADAYGDFLENYPSDREAYEVRFLYAQALYYSFDFLRAARAYAEVRDAAGQTNRQELAGFQVVKSLELVIEEQINAFALPPEALPNYQGPRADELDEDEGAAGTDDPRQEPAEVLAPDPVPGITLQLVDAYDAYVNLGLNSADDPTTQGRFAFLAGKVFYDWRHFGEARPRFEALLQSPQHRCQEEAIYAASLMIDSYRIEGDFENMELWGQTIQSLDFCEGQVDMALIEEFLEEAETMRVGAIFRAAEDLFQAEDYEAAALEYVRLVNQNPESEFAPAALFNSAVGYERIQRYEPAMRMYQRIVDDYPTCEFVNDALYRVAVNSRRFFDFERATYTYLNLAQRTDDESRVRDALLSAAELQEFSAEFSGAAQTYEAFADRFPNDAAAPVARYRAGLMYEKRRDFTQMLRVWRELRREYGNNASTSDTPIDAMVIDSLGRTAAYYDDEAGDARRAEETYRQVLREYNRRSAGDVDSRFAAGKARFYLVEQEFREWEAVPIEGNLQRQQRVTQELIGDIPGLTSAYQEVVSIGSAEWTMAAYFMKGRVYQAFADKLYAVPIPDFGDPVMEEAYTLELEDIASAFEDEAVDNWRVAIEVARRTGIVNEWTIAIIRELNRYLGAEFPLYKEEQDFLQREVISPLPPMTPEGPAPDDLRIIEELDDDGIEELDDDGPDRPSRPSSDGGFEEI